MKCPPHKIEMKTWYMARAKSILAAKSDELDSIIAAKSSTAAKSDIAAKSDELDSILAAKSSIR